MKSKNFTPFIFLLLASIILPGCRNKTYSENVHEAVAKYLGKYVLFPDSMCRYLGDKPFSPEPSSPRYRILTIVQPHGCTSCNMQLDAWHNLASRIENGLGDPLDFELIYVLESEPTDEIMSIVRQKSFRRPLVFDPRRTIRKSNDLPEEPEFSTFLLNSQNKIIALGNPIMMPKVAALYLDKMDVADTPAPSDSLPISISEKNVPLGLIEEGKDIISRVSVRNISDSIVRIADVTSSCPCVTPTMKYRVLRPKTDSEIIIRFSPDSTMHDERTIYRTVQIYVRGHDTPAEIGLYGTVGN